MLGTAGLRTTKLTGEAHHKVNHTLTSHQTTSLCHKEPSDRREQQWLKYGYVNNKPVLPTGDWLRLTAVNGLTILYVGYLELDIEALGVMIT